MKTTVATLAAAVLLGFFAGRVGAQGLPEWFPITFTADLTGDQMVPPVETDERGTIIAVLVGHQLVVTGSYQNLEIFRYGAAIHRAPPGEVGPIVELDAVLGSVMNEQYLFPDETGAEGKFSAVFNLSDEQVRELMAGLWYVQINTWSRDFGEVRGQLTSKVDFSRIEFDPAAQDMTAEDMLGIWREEGKAEAWQYYDDGTFAHLSTLDEAGEVDSMTWGIRDNIIVHNGGFVGARRCAGQYVDYIAKEEEGKIRMVTLLAPEGCARLGTWYRSVRVEP